MAKRRNFSDAFKAKVALEALRGDKTIQEIAAKYQVHPNQVSTWKRQAVEGMADVFARGGKSEGPTEAEVKELHAKIGRLSVENDLYEAVSVNRVAKHHHPQSASANTL
ncbi:transposase [Stappia aggregata IAM 12614]|uniref:Transposase n=1 Tax=Roseibium aggregatum (strain ATCC 25650 / DSM 13394 / JCM 20685 / NBRC 16684 / NCIMB 2208 / IAM 12614 / B1) TaxID=384765 RepID=A0NLJ6_ROSAI|nr:transposase [Roseibium aggregatum]EAV40691.1 transposase [Stappia aggregata IAM 12614] [Roseibium aggregatum IAM 12614]EAV40858.1 transposase [Stappia aggregata IAM 12614] [Roseibium aggregatum IAM 12614]EAV45941.1 transposase [Stappia aggregata IAM 12614] [Roseibium aggregatum IAM 12614]